MYIEENGLAVGKSGDITPLSHIRPSEGNDDADMDRPVGTPLKKDPEGIAEPTDENIPVVLPHDYKKKLGIDPETKPAKPVSSSASRDEIFEEHRNRIAELHDLEIRKNREKQAIAKAAGIQEEDFPIPVDGASDDEAFLSLARQALSVADDPEGLRGRLEEYGKLVTHFGVRQENLESFETNKVKLLLSAKDSRAREMASKLEIAKARNRTAKAYEEAEHVESSGDTAERLDESLTAVKKSMVALRQLITFHKIIEIADDEAARKRVLDRRHEMDVLIKFIGDNDLLGQFHKNAELVSAEPGEGESSMDVMYRRIKASAKITQLKDRVEAFMKKRCPIRMEEYDTGSVMEEDIRLQKKAFETYIEKREPEIADLKQQAERAIRTRNPYEIKEAMSRLQEHVDAVERIARDTYPLADADGGSADVKGATPGHKVLRFMRNLTTPGPKKEDDQNVPRVALRHPEM